MTQAFFLLPQICLSVTGTEREKRELRIESISDNLLVGTLFCLWCVLWSVTQQRHTNQI